MKKLILLLGTLSLLKTGLNAYFYDNQNYPNLECSPCPCFEIGADWLYWNADQSNLVLASEVFSEDGTVNTNVLSTDFKARNGYRIFADYTFCNNEWNIGAIFTHALGKGNDSANVDPESIDTSFIVLNSTSFPIFNSLIGLFLSSVSYDWDLRLNYFDLDLSRPYPLCSSLVINPHIGFRGLWMRQNLNLRGFVPAVTATVNTTMKDKMNAYGVEGGMEANWNIACGFSIIGHLGGSLLYAKINTEQNFVATDGDVVTIHVSDTTHNASPTIDSFIGLQYVNNCWGCPINLHGGWEQHIIFEANHFQIFNNANLTVQGLTLGGSLCF